MAIEDSSQVRSARGTLTAIAICAVLVLSAVPVLIVASSSINVTSFANRPLPGYTVSLLFFIVPATVLGCLHFRLSNQPERRTFWISLALLVSIGLVLDFLFGTRFFDWPNSSATLGIMVPAIGGRLPIEEIVFFVSGFTCLLLLYAWCNDHWFAAYKSEPKQLPLATGLWPLRAVLVTLVILTLIAAFTYKRWFSSTPAGLPGYVTYVMLVAILPPAFCFPAVMTNVNWRAFSFTQLTMVLIYLTWEVSLALPNQWWAFRPEGMTGIYISAWSNLPIEEPLVWLASTFTVVVVYESVKMQQRFGGDAVRLLLGLSPRGPRNP